MLEGNVAQFHRRFNPPRAAREHFAELPVLRPRRRELVPRPRGGAEAHELAGVEAECAEDAARARTAVRFVDVDARGRERHLERQPGGTHGAARACALASEPPGRWRP